MLLLLGPGGGTRGIKDKNRIFFVFSNISFLPSEIN